MAIPKDGEWNRCLSDGIVAGLSWAVQALLQLRLPFCGVARSMHAAIIGVCFASADTICGQFLVDLMQPYLLPLREVVENVNRILRSEF